MILILLHILVLLIIAVSKLEVCEIVGGTIVAWVSTGVAIVEAGWTGISIFCCILSCGVLFIVDAKLFRGSTFWLTIGISGACGSIADCWVCEVGWNKLSKLNGFSLFTGFTGWAGCGVSSWVSSSNILKNF